MRSAGPAAEALADDPVGVLRRGGPRARAALAGQPGGGGPDDPGVDGDPAGGGGIFDQGLEVGGQPQVDPDHGGVVAFGDGQPYLDRAGHGVAGGLRGGRGRRRHHEPGRPAPQPDIDGTGCELGGDLLGGGGERLEQGEPHRGIERLEKPAGERASVLAADLGRGRQLAPEVFDVLSEFHGSTMAPFWHHYKFFWLNLASIQLRLGAIEALRVVPHGTISYQPGPPTPTERRRADARGRHAFTPSREGERRRRAGQGLTSRAGIAARSGSGHPSGTPRRSANWPSRILFPTVRGPLRTSTGSSANELLLHRPGDALQAGQDLPHDPMPAGVFPDSGGGWPLAVRLISAVAKMSRR